MHPSIAYMRWVKTQAPFGRPGVLDCSSSGTPALRSSVHELLDGDIGPLPLGNHKPFGHQELRAAIAFRYGMQPGQVYPAQGTSMANYVLFAAWLNAGDTVLVEHPVYEPLAAAPAALGARVVTFQRRFDEGWALNVDRIAEQARVERARMVVVTSPHNPSAVWTSDDELIALADAVGPDCLVLVDEAYREWGVDDAGKTAALKRPNLAATASLTKVFGLSWLRAGWLIAAEDIVHRAELAFDHMGVVGSDPLEGIIARVVADEVRVNTLRDESIARLRDSRARMERWLREDGSVQGVIPPDSGFAALRFDGLDRPAYDWLLEQHNVLSTPGRYFGLGDDWVRFTWTAGSEVILEALQRLRGQSQGTESHKM